MIPFAPKITHQGFMPLLKDGVCFIKIPKVGSTTANAVLRDGLSWTPVKGPLDEVWEFIALVRHPVERWLSGMAQWQSGACRAKEPVDAAIERMVFDVHTTPQSWWLEGVNAKLFRLEDIQALWRYLDVTTGVHKQTRKKGLTLELTEEHEARILDFYSDDLRLWEMAQ